MSFISSWAVLITHSLLIGMDKLEIQEKLEKMDKIYRDYGGDKETLHGELDDLLLECVPVEIKAMYEKIQEQVNGFWYAWYVHYI